jgi:hypothetical protein
MTYSSTDNCPDAKPCCVDGDYEAVGTCNGDGIQTFQLDETECEKTNLLGDESFVSPEEVTRPCDVDCVQSSWTNSGVCNSSTGRQSQTRTTTTAALNSGTACEEGETRDIDCDVDCEMNDDWTDVANSWWCSDLGCEHTNSCNQYPDRPGEKKQTRTVKTEHQNNGTVCPTDTTRYSNCDVDCVVTGFSGWSACEYDDETGNTYKYSTRTVTTPAQNDGRACPSWMRMKTICTGDYEI